MYTHINSNEVNFKLYFLVTWWWLRSEPRTVAAGLQLRPARQLVIALPWERTCPKTVRDFLEYSGVWSTSLSPPSRVRTNTVTHYLHWATSPRESCPLWRPHTDRSNHLVGYCPLSHLHWVYTPLCLAISPRPILYTTPHVSFEFFKWRWSQGKTSRFRNRTQVALSRALSRLMLVHTLALCQPGI